MLPHKIIFRGLLIKPIKYFATVNLSKLNFENFFRDIQKSLTTSEAIDIYNSYETEAKNSIKYITVTQRLLTRSLTKNDSNLVNKFIEQNLDKIQIDQLNIEEIKDLLIFILNYTQVNSGLIPSSINEFNRKVIQKYFQVHRENSQNIFYPNVIITALKPIYYFYTEFTNQYLHQIIALFKHHPKEMISENLTFKKAVQTFKHVFNSSNIQLRQCIEDITNFITHQSLIDTFQNDTLTEILQLLYLTQFQLQNLNVNNGKLNQLTKSIESYFLNTLEDINGRDAYKIGSVMLKYNPKAEYIVRIYSIIAFSINQKGQTCLNPIFILQSISQLAKNQANLLTVNEKWQQNFIKFLYTYYHSKNTFSRLIFDYLQPICNKKILQHQNYKKLLTFYSEQYKKQASFLDRIIKLQYYIEALQTNKVYTQLSKLKIILSDSFRIFHKASNKQFVNIQMSIQTISNLLNDITNANSLIPQQSESKSITLQFFQEELSFKLFFMQIKLFYLYFSAEKIPKLIKQFKINMKFNNLTRRNFTKAIAFHLKFPSAAYQMFTGLLIQMQGSVQTLQASIHSLLLEKYSNQEAQLNHENVCYLHHIYKEYLPQLYYKLLFVNASLFRQIYAEQRIYINHYIFNQIKKSPQNLLRNLPILYSIVSYYNVHFLSELQNMQLLQDIESIADYRLPSEFVDILLQFCILKNLTRNNKSKVLLKSIIESSLSKQFASVNSQVIVESAERKYLSKDDQHTYDILNEKNVDFPEQVRKLKLQCYSISNIYQYNISVSLIGKVLEKGKLMLSNRFVSETILRQIKYSLQLLSPTEQLALFSFLLKNHIYCDLIQRRLAQFHNYYEVAPNYILSLLSKCPTPKQEHLLVRNMLSLSLSSSAQAVQSLLAIYILIQSPSNATTNFVQGFARKLDSRQIPLFFQLHQKKLNRQLSKFVKYRTQGETIEILQIRMQKIFEKSRVEIEDIFDISTLRLKDSCGKMIIKKILKMQFSKHFVKFTNTNYSSVQKFFKKK